MIEEIFSQFAVVAIAILIGALIFYVVSRFRSNTPFRWANAYKFPLSVLFFVVGLGHFYGADALVTMIPPFIPFPYFWSYATGLLELLFVLGLWMPRYEKLTGLVIIIYLPLVLPFNIYGWMIPGNTPSFETNPFYLYGRIPLQAVFMALAYYGTGLKWFNRSKSEAVC